MAYLERSLGGDVGVAMASWFGNATTEQARGAKYDSRETRALKGVNGPPDYHTYLSNADTSGQRSRDDGGRWDRRCLSGAGSLVAWMAAAKPCIPEGWPIPLALGRQRGYPPWRA